MDRQEEIQIRVTNVSQKIPSLPREGVKVLYCIEGTNWGRRRVCVLSQENQLPFSLKTSISSFENALTTPPPAPKLQLEVEEKETYVTNLDMQKAPARASFDGFEKKFPAFYERLCTIKTDPFFNELDATTGFIVRICVGNQYCKIFNSLSKDRSYQVQDISEAARKPSLFSIFRNTHILSREAAIKKFCFPYEHDRLLLEKAITHLRYSKFYATFDKLNPKGVIFRLFGWILHLFQQ